MKYISPRKELLRLVRKWQPAASIGLELDLLRALEVLVRNPNPKRAEALEACMGKRFAEALAILRGEENRG